jgi:hypothetical protein
VSKKPEVFPGKIVCAIVEKIKADNPKPETIIPITVVRYIQERGECGRPCRPRAGTDDLVGETSCNSLERRKITCVAAHPREELEQDERKQCSASGRLRIIL